MTEIDALGWDDDVAFARHLVEDDRGGGGAGLVLLPAIPRTAARQVRFAFCKKDATLDEAERRLTRLRSAAAAR